MGWIHAGLVVVAVMGGSCALANMPIIYQIGVDEGAVFVARDIHELQTTISHLVLLIPPPIVIGMTIWRGKAFGEPDGKIARRITLPGWATIGVLGLWWVMLWGSVGMYQISRWLN